MADKSKKPEIRFEGFTETWEQRKLGDHSEIVAGGTPNTGHPEYWNPKEIPWMSSGEINNKVISSTDNMISKIGFLNSSAKWVKEKSVLIALAGQGKTRGTVAISEIPLTTNQSIAAIQPDSFLYYKFLFQNLEGRYNELREVSSGDGTRGGLNKQIISDLEVLAPEIQEQIKIGDFLCGIDNLITLHQRKYEKLIQIKKSMLEKMFPKNGEKTPEIRFAGFTDDWEQRELGDISEKVTRKNQDIVCDEVLTNSAEYGIISQRDFFDKDIANSENIDGYYIVEPNDFVYNPRISTLAPFGPIRRNKLGKSGAMSPLYYVFRTHDVDYGFLEYYFKTNCWYSFMHLNGNSGARSDRFAIRDDIFKEMPITIPQDIVEQQQIGDYFTNLDKVITLHQRKYEKLIQVKKSMLEKMFV